MVKTGLIKTEEVLSGRRKSKVYSVLPRGEKVQDKMDLIMNNL